MEQTFVNRRYTILDRNLGIGTVWGLAIVVDLGQLGLQIGQWRSVVAREPIAGMGVVEIEDLASGYLLNSIKLLCVFRGNAGK